MYSESKEDKELEFELEDAYEIISKYLRRSCVTPQEDSNVGNVERVTKALKDMVWPKEKVISELRDILTKDFGTVSSKNTVIQLPIETTGLCPHHYLPITYRVTYGYTSDTTLIGLSKLTRIARVLSHRPIMQEQYTSDLVNILGGSLLGGAVEIGARDTPPGIFGGATKKSMFRAPLVGAIVTGVHSCMKCRGVYSGAETVTDAMYSNFISEVETTKFMEKLWMLHMNSK